jgi:predicted transcriptional regulator
MTRRERQIMDIVHKLGPISAADIHRHLPDPPTSNAVRTWLRILEEKGHIKYRKEGVRHLYVPTTSWSTIQRSALKQLLRALFDGSPTAVVSTLLEVADRDLTPAERKEIAGMIKAHRGK